MYTERVVMSNEKEQKNKKSIHLEWRDYVALIIASLQTIMLPIIVCIVVLILLVLILGR